MQVQRDRDDGESDSELPMLQIGDHRTHPITVDVLINGRELSMELDTGAAISIISEETQKRVLPDAVLNKSSVALCTYTGKAMAVVGQLKVQVSYKTQSCLLPLIVVAGKGQSLFG